MTGGTRAKARPRPQPYSGPERRLAKGLPQGWLGPLRRASDALAMPSFAHLAHVDRSVVAAQRGRLAHLVAAPASAVPGAAQARAALGEDGLAYLAQAFVAGTPPGQRKAVRRPARALADLVQRGTCLDSELHDAYFGVVRSERPDAFVRAVTACMDNLRAEARAGSLRDEGRDLPELAEGLRLCFTIAAGRDPGPPRLARSPRRTLAPAGAARRWLRGHQIFLVLTQAMLIVLADLDETSPEAARLAAIETLVALMAASAAAMRLTGDFAPDIYDGVIRPTMAPPFMPDSFSGLFSSDHKLLVARLRELRSLLEDAGGALEQARSALASTFAAVYDSHIAVCSRFVGADRASLLMTDKASCNAIEQLTKFKNSRLRLVRGK